MSKHFKNRTAKEWRLFLEAHGYKFINQHGDDKIYAHPECMYVIKVPDRDSEVIILTTSDYMARAVTRCGKIARKDILKWWSNNGHGE